MKAIKFVNFSDETFIGKYDGEAFTYEPGKEEWLPSGIAMLFAKHLIDREINKLADLEPDEKKRDKISTMNEGLRRQFGDKCLFGQDVINEKQSDLKADIDILNKEMEKKEKVEKQGNKVKKKQGNKEEEFDGLKN